MPRTGFFTLHNNAIPDLPAGPYTLGAEQVLTAPGATPQRLDVHLEVTAPRFALPRDQILSTFPPNQAEGDFSSRLAQIVLRRRTIPWERSADGGLGRSDLPWLSLVVLADAEGEFRPSRPIAECVTPGVSLQGRNDVAVGDAIAVTRRVVQQVFPTKEELRLLAHVRNVDLSDTDLALGDDDGWLAVVFSNRLPQPGIRYRACLVSLEGQYDALPDAAEVEPDPPAAIGRRFVYPEAARAYDEQAFLFGAAVDAGLGMSRPLASGAATRAPAVAAARSRSPADAWSSARSSGVARAVALEEAPPARTAQLVGVMHGLNLEIVDPGAEQLIFPLLAHWQFTCTGAGDFQSLAQALDVGMLGTLPRPPRPGPGGKPPPPATRPPPQVLDTGHVALEHLSRAGEPGAVWYRGPLVPRPCGREEPDPRSGILPLLHASDQVRRVGPGGRGNWSLAAAFEIGRLLALAEPSVVAALLAWRKDGFAAARRDTLIAREPSLSALVGLMPRLELGARATATVLAELGAAGPRRFGKPRPPVDPGQPIDAIDEADPVALLATGLGLTPEVVQDLIAPGTRRVGPVAVPVARQPTGLDELAERPDRLLGQLREAVLDAADRIGRDALAPVRPGGTGRGDPLDGLLREGRPR